MSDTIIGVIIGGVIGSIVPLVTLLLDHKRWKRQAKLEYLKSERARLEELFESNLKQFAESVKNDSYSSDMASDIMVLMPKEVSERFLNFMEGKNKTAIECKHAYMDLAVAMKKALAAKDDEIQKLFS